MCEDCTAVARDPCSSYTSPLNATQHSTGRLTVANLDAGSVNWEIRGTARVDIYCKYIEDCNTDDRINPRDGDWKVNTYLAGAT